MSFLARGDRTLEEIVRALYDLNVAWELILIEGHEGGRNQVYVCKYTKQPKYVIRISSIGDREEEDYLAEVEYVHFLAKGGASVADIIPSINGKMVEKIIFGNREVFISCFEYAKGMLISDNGYRYIEGKSLSEYFYNTGKVLGKIHKLSKRYKAEHHRQEYFDKYNMAYIEELIPQKYSDLKAAIAKRLEMFQALAKDSEIYGLVHFDFSDGNYHIDMETGDITVFDFDNCMYCWYMFDLANLWTHGVGWFQFEEDKEKRREGMQDYFAAVIEGYKAENELSAEMLDKLPLFIDMVLIENIVDECECCIRAGEVLDYEDIKDAAECLIHGIPYAGFI